MLVFVALIGCQPDPPVAKPGLWSVADDRPTLDHPFFAEHDVPELSLYATRVSGTERPDHAHRGPFAVGNGRAFAFVGLRDPVNTVHSMVGPIYRVEGRFFGDFAVSVDGLQPHTEWVARPRGTALVVTRADADAGTFYTVDWAPLPADRPDTEAPPMIVREVLVEGPANATVRVSGSQPLVASGAGVADDIGNGRVLRIVPVKGRFEADGDDWILRGNRHTLLMTTGGDDFDAAWLDDTLAWWRDFSARGVQLELDDPRIVDLYDGMRVGIRVQQTPEGGVSPMSRYTGVWLRDTVGPVRFFLRAGLHEEARRALDYLYWCHIDRGDFGNSCRSGLTEAEIGTPPDWDALGPFSGRTAAEGPSYVPLMYRDLVQWTGDDKVVDERWAYLRRSLLAQQIDGEGRQPWSGDETFRAAMEVSLGYPLEHDWPELAWSANSSMLLAGAAAWMAQAADDRGENPQPFEDLEDAAHNALSKHFLRPEGHFAPFILRSGPPEKRPFEDVNLKALWVPSHAPDDPVALSNLRSLQDHAARGDGTLVSPLDHDLAGTLGVTEGMLTGMQPGYYLYNLTAIDDPEAELAFNALHTYATTSGSYAEGMVYDDFSALQPIYDELGVVGDVSARYRPWEGGINLDAALFYLLGATCIDGSLEVRPHLPNGLPRMKATGLRCGKKRFTVEVERGWNGLGVTISEE